MRWLLNIRNKHLAPERLSEYLDGRLAGRALQRAEAHLSACAACRLEVESLRATVTLLRRTPQVTPRRSFVLMQPPVSAPLPRRPRRALAPAWAFSAAATVLVAIFVTVLSLDVGGALAPVSPVPVPSPTSRVLEAPASTPTPVPAPSPARALEAQAPTPLPDGGAFGIAAVPGPTPSPAPPLFAAPQPAPAPGGELLAGAAEKPAGVKADTEDASRIPAPTPSLPTRVLSEEPMAPGRTYSQESILSGGSVAATTTPAPGGGLLASAAEKAATTVPPERTDTSLPAPVGAQDNTASEIAAAPEATSVQAVVQGPTPWGWRLAEGLLAAGVLLVGGLGLWRWGRARRAVR